MSRTATFGRFLLPLSLSIVCFGPAAPAHAATAAACVSTQNPPCRESSFFSSSAFQWGVKTLPGGALLRGVASADARKLGVEFLARTQLGASSLVSGSSSAFFADDDVVVGSNAVSGSVTLTWLVAMSGGFSGSDYGPPCEHCGGQSPWTSSGVASGLMEAFGPDGQHPSASFHGAWNSNDGTTEPLSPATLMQVEVKTGQPFSWSSTMTVQSTAENYPCRVGAGTCSDEGGAEVDGDFRSTFRFHDFHLYDGETQQEIDDFTLTGSNGIDYLAIDRGCGNGTLDDGEECDDGNAAAGDCCSAGCKLETGACDDGDPCSGDGVCNGATCGGAERFSCPLPCGDAGGSGTRTAVDALVTLKTAVGSAECDGCRCNANHDGGVTSTDALQVLRAAVGVDVTLDCPVCLPDF